MSEIKDGGPAFPADCLAEIELARNAVRQNPDMAGIDEADPHFSSMVTLELGCRLNTARYNIKLASAHIGDDAIGCWIKRQLHSGMADSMLAARLPSDQGGAE